MERYQPSAIEPKWQEVWQAQELFKALDTSEKKKYYILVEFPYPSGEGLHVGHLRSYTALDILARKRRMEGFNVLYPIGWDAFGLPAENYALKTGVHPKISTEKNIGNFKRQCQMMGFSFDWSREVATIDPEYYKWTQWIFLQLFNKGLAYQAQLPINWCPKCKIGLANEEVVAGNCERCGTLAEKKELKQWMLKITAYAERLIQDLDTVDYLERIKTQQINWIGKSEGAELEFAVENSAEKIKVFTTRPDTLFGATYLVLAPEHELVEKLKVKIENYSEVEAYINLAKNKSDLDRTSLEKEKTGVELKGVTATNPANGKEIPVWIADYVLNTYGTGAIMAVPAHDERDQEFAQKYRLSIIPVIQPPQLVTADYPGSTSAGAWGTLAPEVIETCWTGEGNLINSGEFSGLDNELAKEKIIKKVGGKKTVNYKLRDWVFSRQHYWGEPIPIIHCSKCGCVPVPEKDLPVLLPEIEKYQPTGTGESPLAAVTDWVNTTCPKCGGAGKRETDTMPNWAGSSWYFLRYLDPKNTQAFASAEKLKHWLPVDWYNGGMEHTTLHLLYSRFWHKVLFDLGFVPTSEPYQKRTAHGMILAENGEKMSKSRGNVINPDDMVKAYGADVVRVYEMFMGPFDQAAFWSTKGMEGAKRFLDRIWNLQDHISPHVETRYIASQLHRTIKKVTNDIESMSYNTAVASMMTLVNEFYKAEKISVNDWKLFLQILSPFAPHLAEELWRKLGNTESILKQPWPKFDEKLIIDEQVTIVVQVNGKLRANILVARELISKQTEIEKLARAEEKVQKYLTDITPKKIIYVPGKLINFVV